MFDFPDKLWAQIVYHLPLAFAFNKEFASGDLRNSLVPLYHERVAGSALEIQALKAKLERVLPDEAEHLASLEVERQIEELVDEFIHQKPDWLTAWTTSEEAILPPIPKVTYHEFIPRVPLVVPLGLTSPNGKMISANDVYDSILLKHKKEFEQFVHERLGIPREANSPEITGRILDFMHQVETELDNVLLPGNLSTVKGTQEIVDAIFRHFPRQDIFALIPGMASWLLRRHPPQLTHQARLSQLEHTAQRI